MPNRTKAKTMGGTSAMAALTATTLAPQVSMTSSVATSAPSRALVLGLRPRAVM